MPTLSLREGTAISNLDGRLWNEAGAQTGEYFGDEAMVKTRIEVEARYLMALSETGIIRKLTEKEKNILLSIGQKVTPRIYTDLRKIEVEVRHDVMAMTQMMKKLLDKTSLVDLVDHGWVHWGLTSEDVDNLSRSTLLSSYLNKVYLPQAAKILEAIIELAQKTGEVVIPGKTHLQRAVPTLLGKEIALFGVRLGECLEKIKELKLRGKMTGAVGNLSAQKCAYPKVNWRKVSSKFIESLGLEANLYTTQIEPRAKLIELLGLVESVNSILVDLSQDMRLYIGFDWFIQAVKKEEYGSSAMPQKVNPIDFENSAGNALLSNWILEGLIRQLPVSWLQRDLVDKTILRNLGLPFGYSLISIISAVKGLSRLTANEEKIEEELNNDWSTLAEAFQIKLRAMGVGDSYEKVKELSRGKRLTKEEVWRWIEKLTVGKEIKIELKNINHQNYVGYAKENLREMIDKIKAVIKTIA